MSVIQNLKTDAKKLIKQNQKEVKAKEANVLPAPASAVSGGGTVSPQGQN